MKRLSLAQGSWVLFDFANSIFFVNIVSVYFPIYFVDELGGSAFALSLAFGVAQILTGLSAIYWGAVADKGQRYRQLFVAFTLLTVLSALVLPLFGAPVILIVFLIGFYLYATTGVFYDAMLPGIADAKMLPRIIGLGGGAGMLGNMMALVLVTPFLVWGIEAVFVVTGLGYLLFALPTLIFVRPKMAGKKLEFIKALTTPAKWLKRYLAARVLYGGALITLIIYMPLMGRQLFGLDDGQIRNLYIVVSLAAGSGAVLAGLVARRLRPLRLLIGGLAMWVVFGLVATTLQPLLLYVALPIIAFFAGVALSADRIFFIEAAAGAKLGEFLGLHRLAYLGGGVVVPILFGGLLGLLDSDPTQAYRVGLLVVGVLLLCSLLLLRPLVRLFKVPA